jgi:outer membrane protein assembly factor BamB
MLLALVACAEYLLVLDPEPDRPAFDPGVDPAADSGSTPVEETCNGIDDDDDGEIDEGYPDADQDGLADCVDRVCTALWAPGPGLLPVVAACEGTYLPATPTEDAFSSEVAWSHHWAYEDHIAPGASPLVVHLDDDDGDGRAGPGDRPDVLVASWGGDAMYVFDGPTGTLERTLLVDAQYYQTPAVADVDGDGFPEIYRTGYDGAPIAFAADGTVLWESADRSGVTFAQTPTLADLDGDGAVELLVDDLVIDARTGTTELRLDVPGAPMWRSSVAADLDLDGTAEILVGGRVFGADGSLRWEVAGPLASAVWMFPVQADADPEGEVVFVGNAFVVLDTDGTELARTLFPPGVVAGAPTAADFDGDGVMEVGMPFYDHGGFSVFGLDGLERWNAPGPPRSIAPGATAFDFQGDGSYEILYPDETGLVVYDGATGAEVMRFESEVRLDAFELATVADIDGDGAAEVLVSSYNATESTLSVLRHAGSGWPPAGERWPQYEFTPGAIDAFGHVSTDADPPWLCPGVWRAWPALDGACGRPDLVVTITDVCVEDCADGPTTLAFQVGNQGALPVARAVVDVEAQFGAGRLPVATVEMGEVQPGELLGARAIVLPADAAGATGYIVRVRDGGDAPRPECDPGNDEDDWLDVCP